MTATFKFTNNDAEYEIEIEDENSIKITVNESWSSNYITLSQETLDKIVGFVRLVGLDVSF